ncbi:ADP-ribose pyrophosphatase YjhB, NUDIX family [Nocardioides alpinus]|uniref:ADP-ribose pyrophosphatase YjhB, NUDIX family n=1 Tax=Nocardioides alpinus TaxID=748909 RepID=A0A1I0ZN40_9ACTN|nr:NUDIX domain-containing protein [Nocardioides alpinus]PKH41916.1 NUDIX domain-containing protein [Nocardioides alpinus]SFB27104.1 ADP-ribose pyrophosphatase YjhB, NUDIX family [Nocardioides alpinus]
MTVKLLLLDEEDRLLLINGRDPRSGDTHWYPVGGGIEPGESLQEAAAREAHEETGLAALSPGVPVWTRDHTYRYDGRTVEVHEDWLVHTVPHFDPAPAAMSAYEARSVVGFRWWRADELCQTRETVYPPALGELLTALLRDGAPPEPIDLTHRAAD